MVRVRSFLKSIVSIVTLGWFFSSNIASAHEAYVLPSDYFWPQLNSPPSSHALDALSNPNNLRITLYVVLGVLIVYGLNFLFRLTKFGRAVHHFPEKFSFLGPAIVRITMSVAFFYSAWSWSFLGPEISLNTLPWPWVLRIILFVISGLIALGLFTEIAALTALVLFTIAWTQYGLYLITYLNYLGEIVVLILFGTRTLSLDGRIFGPLKRFLKLKPYDTTIVRVCYGIALIYAAIEVKFLHPTMTTRVVVDWHLTQFHWLFPSDPLLVVLGAGLSELAIGLFIFLGFEMRITVLVSLFYITLSLLYFRELVWPHLLLYGISINLLVQPEIFTLDHFFFEKERKKKKLLLRPLLPHIKKHSPGN